MKPARLLLVLLFALACAAQDQPHPVFLARFADMKFGVMASTQRCALIFADHTFHFEHADVHRGKDLKRKVYDGTFTPAEWDALMAVLDAKPLHDLNVPPQPTMVVEDLDLFSMNVWRGDYYQNLEFLDKNSRKPYQSTLKPVLHWWKSFVGRKMTEGAKPSPHCANSQENMIFAPGL